MEWLIGLIGLVIGVAAGAGIAIAQALSRRAAIQAELANAKARAELLDQQSRQILAEIERVRGELDRANQAREAAERQNAVLNEQLAAKQKHFDEQRQLLDDAKNVLRDTFRAVGGEVLEANSKTFIEQAEQKLNPVKELLTRQNTAIAELETNRKTAYATFDQKVQQIAASHERLGLETGRLVTALRRPEQRGRWGNMQLRNTVEAAGMAKYCDFDEEVNVVGDDGVLRPDMVVRIPGGVIVVDAKVALSAYLDAIAPDADRATLMPMHARQVEEHVRRLAAKKYWEQFERSPKLVVMFMPLESALIAALDVNPEIYTHAMHQHVMIATPSLLIALFLAVAAGWQEEDIAANARQIKQVGQDLYDRLAKFVEGLEGVGDRLKSAVKAYNDAIGSLEHRVLPSTRKLKELHATTEAEIEAPLPIEIEVRPVVSPELKALPQGTADEV